MNECDNTMNECDNTMNECDNTMNECDNKHYKKYKQLLNKASSLQTESEYCLSEAAKIYCIKQENYQMSEEEFYQQCAIAAMQAKISLLADIAPEKTTIISFNIADAMLKEYRKRKNHQKTDNK